MSESEQKSLEELLPSFLEDQMGMTDTAEVLRVSLQEARRYRLLRRGQQWSVIDGAGTTLRAEELDAAIDAALDRK